MEDTIHEIGMMLQQSLANLRARKSQLQAQLNDYEALQTSLTTNKLIPLDGVLVSIGEGYWVTKDKESAKEFLIRKIQALKEGIGAIELNLKNGEETLLGVEKLAENEAESDTTQQVNEDGLPFIDIQEEIDEDGNVINVKLTNGEGGSEFESYPVKALEPEAILEKPSSEPVIIEPQPMPTKEDEVEESNKDEDQIAELLEDLELVKVSDKSVTKEDILLQKIEQAGISAEDMEILKQAIDREATSVNHTAAAVTQFSKAEKDDLYQLELIASELDDQDSFNAYPDDDEDFSYDMDDVLSQSDDDDDGYADELLYGMGASLLPRDDARQQRFWADVQALRQKPDFVEPVAEKNSKKKTVRFSEKVEFKEIENISESLRNIEHTRSGVSKFKENRILSGASNGHLAPTPGGIKTPQSVDEVTSDIIEHEGAWDSHDIIPNVPLGKSSSAGVVSDVFEHVSEDETAAPQAKKVSEEEEFENLQKQVKHENQRTKLSKFRQMMIQNPNQRVAIHNELMSIPAPSQILFEKDIIGEVETSIKAGPTTPLTSESIKDFGSSEPVSTAEPGTEEIRRLNIDVSQLRDDMDSMVQAYNVGMFDEDIETHGPLVDKLEDFEVLNRMVSSMTKDTSAEATSDKVSKSDDHDEALNEIGALDSDDDSVIMVDEIVENDYSDADMDDSDGDGVQDSILGKEVEDNYFKLREKLLPKANTKESDEELIEDAPRVSKFMAARQNALAQAP